MNRDFAAAKAILLPVASVTAIKMAFEAQHAHERATAIVLAVIGTTTGLATLMRARRIARALKDFFSDGPG